MSTDPLGRCLGGLGSQEVQRISTDQEEVVGVIFVGDDWAEDHHDVYIMDSHGGRLAARRLPEGIEGVRALHAMVGLHVQDATEVRIGIETDRGLWVQALVAAGYQVLAVNPKAASRYRERHHVAGGKSDAGDAKMLADLARTDSHNHRLIAGDSAQVEGVKVLARAHQSLIWSRTREANRLRNALREYYPAALVGFEDLDDRDALAVLARAPDPTTGARLTLSQITSILRHAGRRRYLGATAQRIQDGLRGEHLRAPEPLVAAYAATTRSLVALLGTLNTQIAALEQQLDESFEQHPDADIYLSLPGMGDVLGARVLGEFGDDPERFAHAKSRRNYAGTSPLTIASGKKRAVMARYVRNKRLYDAIDQWAFCSLTRSPGARTFYDERRVAGYEHHEALRALGNRWVAILHGCLKHRTPYDEHIAWAHRQAPAA